MGTLTRYTGLSTVCHVPPGLPPTCAFKACIAQKELCERNNSDFFCAHIEEIQASKASEPENDLLVEECRSVTVISSITYTAKKCRFWPENCIKMHCGENKFCIASTVCNCLAGVSRGVTVWITKSVPLGRHKAYTISTSISVPQSG